MTTLTDRQIAGLARERAGLEKHLAIVTECETAEGRESIKTRLNDRLSEIASEIAGDITSREAGESRRRSKKS